MTDLIKRMEEAEAGSRELDEEIHDLLCATKTRTCILGLTDEAGGLWMYEFPGHAPASAWRVTESLDAARAFADRVHPDGWLDLDVRPGRTSHARQCFEGNRAHHAEHSSPIIAACIAILKATDTEREA